MNGHEGAVGRGQAAAPRGLLLDYGGVLTRPVQASFTAFEQACGIEPGTSLALLLEASRDAKGGVIGALERGELAVEDFEAVLHERLREAGHDPPGDALVEGLFAAMTPDGPLWDLAARARAAGVRTGLLSNSWGTNTYPRARLRRHFDVVVISGEVGLRKPDPAIYRLALDRLGVPAASCVFVDDLERNVAVASELGMAGVVHRGDHAEVLDEVNELLDLDTGMRDEAAGSRADHPSGS